MYKVDKKPVLPKKNPPNRGAATKNLRELNIFTRAYQKSLPLFFSLYHSNTGEMRCHENVAEGIRS